MENTCIRARLRQIQGHLKAPKGQFNNHGKYKYRSCEDILESVKTLLPNDCCLTISDEMVVLGDRYYVKATATFADKAGEISTTAMARETEIRKGMDAAQITGAASSYARKYALNGLFAIDDSKLDEIKDPDDPKFNQPSKAPVKLNVNKWTKPETKPLEASMDKQNQAKELLDLCRILSDKHGWSQDDKLDFIVNKLEIKDIHKLTEESSVKLDELILFVRHELDPINM